MSGSGFRMAWAQNAMSRDVSVAPLSPMHDLNHWRFSSTKLTTAIGTSNAAATIRVYLSNDSSGCVSRMPRERSA
jgi:hypothetical protein